MSLLFEQPLALGLLLAAGLGVILGMWVRSRSLASARALAGGLVLSALLLILQAVVVTDREKLEAAVRQMSAHVEAGEVNAILSLFDRRAAFPGGHDLADFEQHLTFLLEKYDVKDPGVGAFEIELGSGEATVRCGAHCRISLAQGEFPIRSKWELRFRLLDGEWKVVDLRPISILDRPYESFFDID